MEGGLLKQVCSSCNIEKDSDEYYFRKDTGRNNLQCKLCKNAVTAEYRRDHPQLPTKESRVRQALAAARSRSRKLGMVFDIELDDVEMRDNCPVFGPPLDWGHTRCRSDSPSLDKVIPELGYVKGNVYIISHKANRLKNNATKEELQSIVDWLELLNNKDKV